MDTPLPDAAPRLVSLAVELDNSVHGDWDDVAASMRSIGEALSVASASRDLAFDVVMLTEESAGRDIAADEIAKAAGGAVSRVTTRVLQDTTYFEKKAFAAVDASTELVLFADCDCVYEPEWASTLIAAFDDPDVEMASGRTLARTASATATQRSASLVWMFPLDDARDPRRPVQTRYANNFAVRAQLMRDVPIRPFRAYRGQGHEWLRELDARGVRNVFLEDARAFHRQFRGLSEVVAQAWREGTDRDIDMRLQGKGVVVRGVRIAPAAVLSFSRGVRILANVRPPGARERIRARALGYTITFHATRAAGQAWSCLRGDDPLRPTH